MDATTWIDITIVLFSVVCFVSANTRYDGSKILNVFNEDQQLLQDLAENEELDVWFRNQTNIEFLVQKRKMGAVKRFLRKQDIPYLVRIDDVQNLIDKENIFQKRRSGFRLNNYNRLDGIYKWMDSLSDDYPEMVSIETIGYSHEGRALKVAKVSWGEPDANAVFIDAGIHAREWISVATAIFILDSLVTNQSLLSPNMMKFDYYILPVLNPDGYEYSHTSNRLWRKNRSGSCGQCVGIDLNRNFAASFGGKGTSDDPCDEIFTGPSPFSEPETKAFSEYIIKIKKLRVYISFHSYGQLILLPYSYDKNAYPTDFEEIKEIGMKARGAIQKFSGTKYKVGRPPDILYAASGGSADWVKETAKVKFAYTYELRDLGQYGFVLPSKQIITTAREAFEGVKVMVEAAAKSFISPNTRSQSRRRHNR
ncbi:unnamed protein product [Nezara viridula]|uniref:Peptidase M14 domain-containing protein n=1 Tax=Nezara viridula TaxID=85310 RepID=A0A9P0HFY3_NEZVI|nr:unnamed protein product [Nezara viridula]